MCLSCDLNPDRCQYYSVSRSVKGQSTISWDVPVSLNWAGKFSHKVPLKSFPPSPPLSEQPSHHPPAQHLHPWNLLFSVQFKKYFFCLDHFSLLNLNAWNHISPFPFHSQVSEWLAIFLSPSNQEACF